MQDSQLQTTSTSMDSSSSNTSSRRNSAENIHYPELLSKQDRQKTRWSSHKTLSIGFGSVTEEEFEKDEKDQVDIKKQVLPHLQMINDYQEFSQKISRTLACGRKRASTKKEYRRRSCTPSNHALPKVEEEIIPEDDEFRNKHVFKFGLMLDKNEFNTKINRQRTLIMNRVEKKEQSIYADPQPILEDLREGENMREKQPALSPFQVQSPRYMLKVDEVFDFKSIEKKLWNHDTQEQEVIMEEVEEPNSKGHQMFNKINSLLTEDRDYLKRIAKGEEGTPLDQFRSHDQDQQLQQLIEEAVQSNSDSDEPK